MHAQAAISTPGPAPFFDRPGMTETKAKKLFDEKEVWELMKLFKLSRASVFAWRKKWGITTRVTASEAGLARIVERQQQRRERTEKEHDELVQLRAENAVLQRLVRDLTLEVARLTGKEKKS